MKKPLQTMMVIGILATLSACSTTNQSVASLEAGSVVKPSARQHAGFYVSKDGRIVPYQLP